MRSDPGPVDDDLVVEEIKEALKEDCNTLRYPCGKGKWDIRMPTVSMSLQLVCTLLSRYLLQFRFPRTRLWDRDLRVGGFCGEAFVINHYGRMEEAKLGRGSSWTEKQLQQRPQLNLRGTEDLRWPWRLVPNWFRWVMSLYTQTGQSL